MAVRFPLPSRIPSCVLGHYQTHTVDQHVPNTNQLKTNSILGTVIKSLVIWGINEANGVCGQRE